MATTTNYGREACDGCGKRFLIKELRCDGRFSGFYCEGCLPVPGGATTSEQTEAQADPRLALTIAMESYAGALYEATRTTYRTLASKQPITPWSDLTTPQRNAFARGIADAFTDLVAAVLATGSRP